MFCIKEGIKAGLENKKCSICNNDLSVIFGGLFGENAKKVERANIKYICGCCFRSEYYYCYNCKKYFNVMLKEI